MKNTPNNTSTSISESTHSSEFEKRAMKGMPDQDLGILHQLFDLGDESEDWAAVEAAFVESGREDLKPIILREVKEHLDSLEESEREELEIEVMERLKHRVEDLERKSKKKPISTQRKTPKKSKPVHTYSLDDHEPKKKENKHRDTENIRASSQVQADMMTDPKEDLAYKPNPTMETTTPKASPKASDPVKAPVQPRYGSMLDPIEELDHKYIAKKILHFSPENTHRSAGVDSGSKSKHPSSQNNMPNNKSNKSLPKAPKYDKVPVESIEKKLAEASAISPEDAQKISDLQALSKKLQDMPLEDFGDLSDTPESSQSDPSPSPDVQEINVLQVLSKKLQDTFSNLSDTPESSQPDPSPSPDDIPTDILAPDPATKPDDTADISISNADSELIADLQKRLRDSEAKLQQEQTEKKALQEKLSNMEQEITSLKKDIEVIKNIQQDIVKPNPIAEPEIPVAEPEIPVAEPEIPVAEPSPKSQEAESDQISKDILRGLGISDAVASSVQMPIFNEYSTEFIGEMAGYADELYGSLSDMIKAKYKTRSKFLRDLVLAIDSRGKHYPELWTASLDLAKSKFENEIEDGRSILEKTFVQELAVSAQIQLDTADDPRVGTGPATAPLRDTRESTRIDRYGDMYLEKGIEIEINAWAAEFPERKRIATDLISVSEIFPQSPQTRDQQRSHLLQLRDAIIFGGFADDQDGTRYQALQRSINKSGLERREVRLSCEYHLLRIERQVDADYITVSNVTDTGTDQPLDLESSSTFSLDTPEGRRELSADFKIVMELEKKLDTIVSRKWHKRQSALEQIDYLMKSIDLIRMSKGRNSEKDHPSEFQKMENIRRELAMMEDQLATVRLDFENKMKPVRTGLDTQTQLAMENADRLRRELDQKTTEALQNAKEDKRADIVLDRWQRLREIDDGLCKALVTLEKSALESEQDLRAELRNEEIKIKDRFVEARRIATIEKFAANFLKIYRALSYRQKTLQRNQIRPDQFAPIAEKQVKSSLEILGAQTLEGAKQELESAKTELEQKLKQFQSRGSFWSIKRLFKSPIDKDSSRLMNDINDKLRRLAYISIGEGASIEETFRLLSSESVAIEQLLESANVDPAQIKFLRASLLGAGGLALMGAGTVTGLVLTDSLGKSLALSVAGTTTIGVATSRVLRRKFSTDLEAIKKYTPADVRELPLGQLFRDAGIATALHDEQSAKLLAEEIDRRQQASSDAQSRVDFINTFFDSNNQLNRD